MATEQNRTTVGDETPRLGREHRSEIARVPRTAWQAASAERLGRHVTRSPGYAEALGTYWERGAYALFEEMEGKDAHLHSILQTRRNGVLARPRLIEPAIPVSGQESGGASGGVAREAAALAAGALAAVADFDSALGHLLGAVGRGMAVVEIVWGYDARGRIVPVRLKPRAPWRFCFDADGALALNEDPLAEAPASTERRPVHARDEAGPPDWTHPVAARTRPLPARKFMVMLHEADDERPYGRGLCERVHWLWWFKKNNLKFWALFNEKFGAPTVVARHPSGFTDAERDHLLRVLGSIQTDAGIAMPDEIRVELLESVRRGSTDTYRGLAEFCNEEMSRAVLGQTLTVGEGSRAGSLAMARVHEAVRFDYIRADANLLMDTVNSQLLRWMTDFNFGPSAPAPRWIVDLVPDLDVEVEARVDRQLLQMGVPLPLRHFYEKYRRPVPARDERQVRYDDHNLYQYHLAFGVMTVNEVRASLGLAPVAWGDSPPVPVAPSRGGSAGLGLSRPVSDSGGDAGEEALDRRGEETEEDPSARRVR